MGWGRVAGIMASSDPVSLASTVKPPQENPLLLERLGWLVVAALLVGALAMGRMYHLTIVQGAMWYERSEQNFLRPRPISPPRGVIVDRVGQPLAENRPVFDVAVRRYRHPNVEVIHAMAALRKASPQPLLRETQEVLESRPAWRPVEVLRGLPPAEAIPLLERVGAWDSLESSLRYQRHYPAGRAAAQLVGYLRQIPGEQLEERLRRGYLREDLVGWTSLELALEDELRGRLGRELEHSDALHRVLESELDEPARPGATVHLTLDRRLQQHAYELLRRTGRPSSLVALDPRQGAIVALVSWPSFDPNTRRFEGSDTEWNRAMRTPTAPASTLKVFSALAILESGRHESATYHCGGFFQFPNYARRFHCDHRSGCGSLTLAEALQRSCNVYFFRGANEIGGERLLEVYRRFGLGAPTGAGADGLGPEASGTLHGGGRALGGDVIMAAIGQGQVSATPIQMARALAALANGGLLHQPHIVQKLVQADGTVVRPARAASQQVRLAPEHRAAIIRGMRDVVRRAPGTAVRVGFDPAWEVAGKTGTAERAGSTDAWFFCFAPASAPRIVVVVRVEEGGAGSQAAAPLARDFLREWFAGDPSVTE